MCFYYKKGKNCFGFPLLVWIYLKAEVIENDNNGLKPIYINRQLNFETMQEKCNMYQDMYLLKGQLKKYIYV